MGLPIPSPCDLPPLGPFCGAAGSITSSVGNSVLTDIAKTFVGGEVEILKLLATSFTRVSPPDVSSAGSTVVWLQGSLQSLTVFAAVLGVIVAAGRMVWSRKAQPASEAFSGLLRLILVSGAGTALVTLMTAASDSFGSWILSRSTKDPSASLSALSTLTTGAFSSPALVLVLAALAIFGAFVQLALIFVQGALVVLLVGVWPLSAAASIIGSPVWFRKVTAWLVAVVLYRFAAAIVFATSFKMMTSSSSSGTGAIDGVVLLVLAAVCLPVVMRLVVPAVAAVGAVGAAEVAGAAAGVAMGAVMVAGTAGAGAAAGASFGAAKQSAAMIPKSGGGAPDGAANAGPAPSTPSKPSSSGRGIAAAQGVTKGIHTTVEKLADGAAAGGEQ